MLEKLLLKSTKLPNLQSGYLRFLKVWEWELRMRVLSTKLRVEIKNETIVFFNSLNFEIQIRVLQKSDSKDAKVYKRGHKQTQINQVVKQKQRKWKGYPCCYHSSCEWQAYNHSSLKHSDLWKIGVSSYSQVSNKSTAGNKSAVGIQVNTKNCELVKFQQLLVLLLNIKLHFSIIPRLSPNLGRWCYD